MAAIFILFFILMTAAAAAYLYHFMKRLAVLFHADAGKKTNQAVFAVLSLLLVLGSFFLFQMGIMILLHFIVLSIIADIVHMLLQKGVGERYKASVWKKIYLCGAVPVILTAVILGYGYYNMHHIIETKYTLETEKEIPEKGFRLALLSDIHYGTVIHKEELQTLADRLGSMDLDMIVLCGDIVEEDTELDELNEVFRILGTAQSRLGSYYVFGNHDKALYSRKPNYTEEQLREQLAEGKIKVLEDESIEIDKNITLAGRKNFAESRMSAEELLKDIPENSFILTLDHQPVEYEENRLAGTDLLLSGHTHAGQIWPIGLFNSLAGMELNYGIEKSGDFAAIVSSGVSGWGFPVKTQGHSEYVIIELVRKQ